MIEPALSARLRFLLGGMRWGALRDDVFAVVKTAPLTDPFAGYPEWLVVLAVTVAAAIVIWILAKLLKWALWLLLVAVLLVGGTAALWLLFH